MWNPSHPCRCPELNLAITCLHEEDSAPSDLTEVSKEEEDSEDDDAVQTEVDE